MYNIWATRHTSQLNNAYDRDECYHNMTTRLPLPIHTPHDDIYNYDNDCDNDYSITHTNPGTDETRREGGDGRERAQTTSDVSFGHPVSFFFFHYSCLFSLLNYIYRYYVCYRDTYQLVGGYDEGIGLKRHLTRRLGTRWVLFLFIIRVYFLY